MQNDPFGLEMVGDMVGALDKMAREGRDPYLVHEFKGGPWHGQRRQQPRLYGIGDHCMPHGDGPVATWGPADNWGPGEHRYLPITGEDVEPVIMLWSLPTAAQHDPPQDAPQDAAAVSGVRLMVAPAVPAGRECGPEADAGHDDAGHGLEPDGR